MTDSELKVYGVRKKVKVQSVGRGQRQEVGEANWEANSPDDVRKSVRFKPDSRVYESAVIGSYADVKKRVWNTIASR